MPTPSSRHLSQLYAEAARLDKSPIVATPTNFDGWTGASTICFSSFPALLEMRLKTSAAAWR